MGTRQRSSVSVDKTGVEFVKDGECLARLRWDDIEKVVAYKTDELTTDLLCFDLTANDGQVYVVHEEIPGFDALEERLKQLLTSFDRDWRQKVLKPPFARNETILYDRSKA